MHVLFWIKYILDTKNKEHWHHLFLLAHSSACIYVPGTCRRVIELKISFVAKSCDDVFISPINGKYNTITKTSPTLELGLTRFLLPYKTGRSVRTTFIDGTTKLIVGTTRYCNRQPSSNLALVFPRAELTSSPTSSANARITMSCPQLSSRFDSFTQEKVLTSKAPSLPHRKYRFPDYSTFSRFDSSNDDCAPPSLPSRTGLCAAHTLDNTLLENLPFQPLVRPQRKNSGDLKGCLRSNKHIGSA